MKKIMMTMLLLLAGLTVSAQVEIFKKVVRKGDPMLGTQDATISFLVENGFSNDSISGSKNIGNGKYMVPCRAILEYLKKGKGHVRFVTTTYGDYIYDVSIAAIKEQ